MVPTNRHVAKALDALADLLALSEADPFKIRAYRKAAQTIRSLGHDLRTFLQEGGDLTQLPGIGTHIAAKIEELVTTGRLRKLERLRQRFPSHLTDLLAVEGLGPKRVKMLYDRLGIASLDALKAAAKAHRIRTLPGFGPALEKKILRGTLLAKKMGKRFLYAEAEPYAEAIEAFLRRSPDAEQVVIAGSFRRRKDTVGDLDVVVASAHPERVIAWFVRYPDIREIVSQGTTRSTVILHGGLQIDLRCVHPESFGATLHYFTGSKSHNIAIRIQEKAKGRKVNEYGIFENGTSIAGRTESEFYAAIGLQYIEPELRERRGELRAARTGTLPRLITHEAIRGDLHVHTRWSDGNDTLERMARAAQKAGYAYMAVTDHSRHLGVTHGLDADRLRQQIEAIDRLNETFEGFTLLKGIEVDILRDGRLALPCSLLKHLDIVVAGVHDAFHLTAARQTTRILKALDQPCVHILAHPSGRLIGQRAPYRLRYADLYRGAVERGVVLEINAQPTRMDLDDLHVQRAKEAGALFAVSTDAHDHASLQYMRYGIYQARRGWLEEHHVINTLPLDRLRALLTARS
jgi:DNA polymerase (family 10)